MLRRASSLSSASMIVDLLDRDIDTEQILSLLCNYDFARFRPETLCDNTLQESIMLCELALPSNGWIVPTNPPKINC